MKLIKAFVHNVRASEVVQALADAGFRNITLQNVQGVLKPLTEHEHDYSVAAGGLVIAETRLSLVVDDEEVDAVTSLIRMHGRVGKGISGYVYVSPVDQVLPIGSKEAGGEDDHRHLDGRHFTKASHPDDPAILFRHRRVVPGFEVLLARLERPVVSPPDADGHGSGVRWSPGTSVVQ